jgi:hypothetical protein
LSNIFNKNLKYNKIKPFIFYFSAQLKGGPRAGSIKSVGFVKSVPSMTTYLGNRIDLTMAAISCGEASITTAGDSIGALAPIGSGHSPIPELTSAPTLISEDPAKAIS